MVFTTCTQRLPNRLEHAIHVFEHLVVPEPQNKKASTFQKNRTQRICFSPFRMLTAIQFDHDHSFQTRKIEDVIGEGMLPPELATIELPCT